MAILHEPDHEPVIFPRVPRDADGADLGHGDILAHKKDKPYPPGGAAALLRPGKSPAAPPTPHHPDCFWGAEKCVPGTNEACRGCPEMDASVVSGSFWKGVRNALKIIIPFWGLVIWLVMR